MTDEISRTETAIHADVPESGSPQLMIVFRGLLKREAAEHVKIQVEQALLSGKPFVIEGAKVFQLIDGQWRALD